VVSQTTFRRSEYRRICAALRRRQPDITVRDTTCAATERRQGSLRALADRVDAIVVVGGTTSANTRWLFQTAVATGKPAWHVESAEELPRELSGCATVGLTAGASTPDALIDEVERALAAR
jgi:4-hydroxy-3-methylbut-2-enyl diphosphate reductase